MPTEHPDRLYPARSRGLTGGKGRKMTNLEQILQFLDQLFQPADFPDYPNALNGLQVARPGEVTKVGAAVDASLQTLLGARDAGVDLLLVHHGLFWDGLGPLTGPRFRKVEALIRGNMALYSMHLPLDAHPELGNCALLLKALGMAPKGRFGAFQGVEIGWWGDGEATREALAERAREAVEGEVQVIPGGPREVRRVGVLTGAGAGSLEEAASLGLDTLVTGEAPHHAFHDAMELGVNLLLAGHYATEVFGVRALAQRVSKEFGLPWEFLSFPTGL